MSITGKFLKIKQKYTPLHLYICTMIEDLCLFLEYCVDLASVNILQDNLNKYRIWRTKKF